MPSGDVLIDICWALKRDDLESILHVDRARQDVIASAFDGKGPLRVITKASLTRDDFRCSSFEDERILEGAAELLPYLRNAYIKTFEIDRSELDAKTTRSLLELADCVVIDSLQLRGNAFDLIDGALDCRALTWLSRFYTEDGSKAEQDYGDYENYDENVIKMLEERFVFFEEFFKRRTVSNAETIHLVEIPYVHNKAVSSWLHGDDDEPRLSGAKELHIWGECWQGNAVDALITVLEQAFMKLSKFRSDAEPREYKFVARHCPSEILSRKLENDIGDVLEVEVHTFSSRVTVTRYAAGKARRTSIVQNMDGPKVWKFRTARELEKYIVDNNVYELLARSGLIANEMICKCGTRMYLRVVHRTWKRIHTEWGCSGDCENGYRYPFELAPTFHSWFWNFDEYRYPVEAVLKQVISHLCEGPDADETTELDDFQNKFLELYKEILKHEDDKIKDPLERFYAAVARKYPYDEAFVLPVLEYWEYNPINLLD